MRAIRLVPVEIWRTVLKHTAPDEVAATQAGLNPQASSLGDPKILFAASHVHALPALRAAGHGLFARQVALQPFHDERSARRSSSTWIARSVEKKAGGHIGSVMTTHDHVCLSEAAMPRKADATWSKPSWETGLALRMAQEIADRYRGDRMGWPTGLKHVMVEAQVHFERADPPAQAEATAPQPPQDEAIDLLSLLGRGLSMVAGWWSSPDDGAASRLPPEEGPITARLDPQMLQAMETLCAVDAPNGLRVQISLVGGGDPALLDPAQMARLQAATEGLQGRGGALALTRFNERGEGGETPLLAVCRQVQRLELHECHVPSLLAQLYDAPVTHLVLGLRDREGFIADAAGGGMPTVRRMRSIEFWKVIDSYGEARIDEHGTRDARLFEELAKAIDAGSVAWESLSLKDYGFIEHHRPAALFDALARPHARSALTAISFAGSVFDAAANGRLLRLAANPKLEALSLRGTTGLRVETVVSLLHSRTLESLDLTGAKLVVREDDGASAASQDADAAALEQALTAPRPGLRLQADSLLFITPAQAARAWQRHLPVGERQAAPGRIPFF